MIRAFGFIDVLVYWRSMRRLIFSLVILIALAASACLPLTSPGTSAPATAPAATPSGQERTPAPGGTLHYGLTLPVSGIDPHVNASSELGIALSSVYDTLVAQDKAGAFHPHLAESWDISPDGLTYTFKLRRDVKFHDGTPFNAQAVVRNLQRVADPATRSQKAVFLLGPFDHAEAVDEATVKIVLKEPYAPLLDGLSQVYLGMVSPAALDKWGDQYQLHQVGTGPFRFVEYRDRQSLTLERSEEYRWAPAIRVHQGPAYLDRIELRFYPDAAARLPALLSGQADVMGEMPRTDAEKISQAPDGQIGDANYRLYPVAIPGQSVQFFLNTSLPPLDDLRVRQALLQATDRAALVSAVFGSSSPVAVGPLSAVTHGFDDSLVGRYPFDLEAARRLLSDAGWRDTNGDGILEKAGKPLALKGVLMTWGELPAIGTILQAQWRAAGIDLQLESMAYPAALEAGRAGSHHLMPFVLSGTDPDLLSDFFHSRNLGAFNFSKVSDPEMDAWLDAASKESDWTKRSELYAWVQQRVMDQAWILPIRDQVNLNAASGWVQGLSYDVQGWFPVLYDAWLEPKD
jgi:peptide/nickel transport system substrate-binding protein